MSAKKMMIKFKRRSQAKKYLKMNSTKVFNEIDVLKINNDIIVDFLKESVFKICKKRQKFTIKNFCVKFLNVTRNVFKKDRKFDFKLINLKKIIIIKIEKAIAASYA